MLIQSKLMRNYYFITFHPICFNLSLCGNSSAISRRSRFFKKQIIPLQSSFIITTVQLEESCLVFTKCSDTKSDSHSSYCFFLCGWMLLMLLSITKNIFLQTTVDFSKFKVFICFVVHRKQRVCRPPPSLNDLKSSQVILSSILGFKFLLFVPIVFFYKIGEPADHLYYGFELRSNHLLCNSWLFSEQVAIANDADQCIFLSRAFQK